MNKKEVYEIAKANKLFNFTTKQEIKNVFNKEVLKSLTDKATQEEIVHFVLECSKKIQKRNKNKQSIQSVKEQLLQIRKNRLEVRFKNYFTRNYRSPESAWVDQENTYNIIFNKDCSYSLSMLVDKVYHQNHNWKANELI